MFVAAGACCSSPAIYVDMCPLAMFRKEQLSSDYEIHEVPATPADVGYAAVSRPRVFWVCAHKEHARFVRPVREVFFRISSLLKQCRSLTVPSLFWETDPAELRRERLDSSGKNCVRSTDSDSWMAQLSDFETDNLNKYRSMWASTNRGPSEDAVFLLNQNPLVHRTWTSMNPGSPPRLPTLPSSCVDVKMCLIQRLWHDASSRWATAREKCLALFRLETLRPWQTRVCHLYSSAPRDAYKSIRA